MCIFSCLEDVMKKKIIGMLSLMLCLLLSVSLVACNKNKHEAKSEWKYNDTQHWHECATKGHDDKLDEAGHVWDEGVITTQPTETTEGVKTISCTVCGYQKTEPIAVLEKTAGTVSINSSYAPDKTYDKTPVAAPVLADCTTNNAAGAFSIAWYQKVDGVYGSTPLAAAPVNAGDYKVVVKIAETDDYTEATAENEFTIAKKQLTVTGTTVADKNYDGNTTANVTVGTLNGVVEGEDVTVSASGTFASAAVGNDITVTVTYLIGGADIANYLAPETDVTLTADILDYAKFTISNSKLISGRGTAVEGTVDIGTINVNDNFTLFMASGGSKTVEVSAITVDGKSVDSVTAETEGTIALLLRGESYTFELGDYLVKGNVIVKG